MNTLPFNGDKTKAGLWALVLKLITLLAAFGFTPETILMMVESKLTLIGVPATILFYLHKKAKAYLATLPL